MADTVIIKDNAKERNLTLSEQQWSDLSLIAGRTVKNLCERDDNDISLLVFPDSLDVYGDQIGDSTILEIQDKVVTTGNLMGFVGCRGTNLRIKSRFDKGEDDYFMHYLLEKVFSVNLFDLPHSTDTESVFDFVLFLFPFFLKRALSQGLYKEYVTRHHNDDKVSGVLDVTRHIRLNIPFTGNAAYKTREHTAGNALMELVRHTIEYIRSKEYGTDILSRDEETKTDVALVVDATPSYEKRERERIINRNLRARIHPYYSEYEPLRKICIQILRQEEIKYGKDDDTVYGVLFDGAWLWEEYLNTMLRDLGFTHPKNKSKFDAIHLFKPQRGRRFPDFYNDQMVLDAKYKRYEEGGVSGVSREDLAQVISYMYIRKLMVGGFIVPGESAVTQEPEILHGYGGQMVLLTLPIPKDASTYDDFCGQIAENEKQFSEAVSSLIEQASA